MIEVGDADKVGLGAFAVRPFTCLQLVRVTPFFDAFGMEMRVC